MSERVLANGKRARAAAFFERFEVPDTSDPCGEPIRIRWRLFHCRWFGIYLHKWLKPDSRGDLHNHPWAFVSIVLWGAYIEKRNDALRDRYVNWVNFVPKRAYHNVVSVHKPTWTLMFVGPTADSWGYWMNGRHVAFDKHPESKRFLDALKKRRSNDS